MLCDFDFSCRWTRESEWESSSLVVDFGWKKIAEPVMQLYTETTDGSSIESKESALVWHYQYADPAFGAFQAKEMLDHLENVLANEPVVVKRGNDIVEVKPQVNIILYVSVIISSSFLPSKVLTVDSYRSGSY